MSRRVSLNKKGKGIFWITLFLVGAMVFLFFLTGGMSSILPDGAPGRSTISSNTDMETNVTVDVKVKATCTTPFAEVTPGAKITLSYTLKADADMKTEINFGIYVANKSGKNLYEGNNVAIQNKEVKKDQEITISQEMPKGVYYEAVLNAFGSNIRCGVFYVK